jgi:photosynthetic reaction center cytochrome c subunit
MAIDSDETGEASDMKKHPAATWLTICCAVFCAGPMLSAAPQQTPSAQAKRGGDAPKGAESMHGAMQPGQNHAGQKLAEEQFKNIQALKGIPADQLIPAMQFISASLGVECDFCHNHEAMDSDEKKPKKIARQMVAMMFDIDKHNFEGRLEVTCYSCHRGAAMPVSIPEIKEGPGHAMEANKPLANSTAPKGEELLDKYLAAAGGAEALERITSRVQKGKVTAFDGKTSAVDVYSKGPDKRISLVHLQGGDSVTAFDGTRGWMSVPGRPVHMMSASENEGARVDGDLHFAAHVKSMFEKFSVSEGEKIEGRETFLVEGRSVGKPPLRLYMDKESGLLLRLVRYAQSPLGLNPTQVDYRDYREADGVKVPFGWTVARPGNRFKVEIEELQQNVPVDDSKFAAPQPPPAATRPVQQP